MKKTDRYKDYRRLVDDESGKARWEYCGKYYAFDLAKPALARQKIALMTLGIMQTAAVILAGLINNPGSRQFYIVIPYVAMLFLSVADVWNAVSLFGGTGQLTQRIYERNYLWLPRIAAAQITLCLLDLSGETYFILRGAAPVLELPVMVGAACTAAMAAVQLMTIHRHPCKPVSR
jgi:hypothetical protein